MMQRVMKACGVIVIFCLHMNVGYAMEKLSSNEKKEVVAIRSLNQQELSRLAGSFVLYKVGDKSYQKVILGQRILGSDYYQAYIVEGKGVLCQAADLYRCASDQDDK